MKTIKSNLLILALSLAFACYGYAQAAGVENAKPSTTTQHLRPSQIPQTNHVAPPPASPAYTTKAVPKTKVIAKGSGNGQQHTPRQIQPGEAAYKKPAAAQPVTGK